jgi:hypothetical protein
MPFNDGCHCADCSTAVSLCWLQYCSVTVLIACSVTVLTAVSLCWLHAVSLCWLHAVLLYWMHAVSLCWLYAVTVLTAVSLCWLYVVSLCWMHAVSLCWMHAVSLCWLQNCKNSVLSEQTDRCQVKKWKYFKLKRNNYFHTFHLPNINPIHNIQITNKYISVFTTCLLTKFSPTCFGLHSNHSQGYDIIQEYKNTSAVNRDIITV